MSRGYPLSRHSSKISPAEPGALRFEPLEAAVAADRVTLIGLIASPQHWKQPLLAPSRALTNRTSFAPCFASAACVYLPIKARERSRCAPIPLRQAYSWKCQTATATRRSRGNSRYIRHWNIKIHRRLSFQIHQLGYVHRVSIRIEDAEFEDAEITRARAPRRRSTGQELDRSRCTVELLRHRIQGKISASVDLAQNKFAFVKPTSMTFTP